MLGLGNTIAKVLKPVFLDNYSIALDGTNQYITIDAAGGEIDGAKGTISVWTQLDTTSSQRYLFHAINDASNYIRCFYHASNNQLYWQHKGSGTQVTVKSSGGEGDGNWHHLAYMWDESEDEIKVYLDGVEAETGAELGEFSGSISAFDIGQITSGGNYWIGKINDFAIFDEVIDINRLYNNGSPNDLKGVLGLIGYWRFEEGSGTTVADDSTNSNTGALINTPSWDSSTP